MTATRILHLHFGKDGGAERFMVNLAGGLAERGVEQRFVIRPDRIWKPEIAGHGEIIEDHFRRLSISGQILPWRIRRMVRTWRPNAIMAWMPRASRLMSMIEAPVRLTRLGDYPRHLRHFQKCDLLVTNTPGIAEHCRNIGWDKPLKVVSNFARQIDVHPVARAQYDTPEDAFLVGGSGRFVNRKGLDAVIRAVAQVPDAWLWLAGTGREEEGLRQLARDVGIAERTRFLGWLDEPMHAMASTDAYLMASRHEPLGNVVLEAWHAGVPVVSTRSEGPSWFATDEKDALMVDIDAIDQMTAALNRIRTDRTLAANLVKGGHATLEAGFTRQQVVDQYLAIFRGEF